MGFLAKLFGVTAVAAGGAAAAQAARNNRLSLGAARHGVAPLRL
jgi:hypothetical protein